MVYRLGHLSWEDKDTEAYNKKKRIEWIQEREKTHVGCPRMHLREGLPPKETKEDNDVPFWKYIEEI